MKIKTVYVCTECGSKTPRWSGKCMNCGAWESLVEEIVQSSKSNDYKPLSNKSFNIIKLKDVPSERSPRIKTGIKEFDRALGGGITRGSVVLIGGDPGIGKSTLLLQICGKLADTAPLYISGEESLEQIKLRASRIKDVSGDVLLLADTDLENIDQAIRRTDCSIVVVDSIQTVFDENIESSAGSIAQIRQASQKLMKTAKETGKPIFIVGHITKEGSIAGPKVLEHIVDTVLQFEGDKTHSFRILRSLKNRFGSTYEIGVFEMREDGLNEVTNPSEIFLSSRGSNEPGVAILSSMEGARPFIIESQALASPSGYSVPQRNANGYDFKRLQMLLAVLDKRLGLNFRALDVFVNIAGGLNVNDPACDFGVAMSLISSYKDAPLPHDMVIIGEIGLTGEIRQVSFLEQRLNEAVKLGFKSALVPKASINKLSKKPNIELIGVERLSLALAKVF